MASEGRTLSEYTEILNATRIKLEKNQKLRAQIQARTNMTDEKKAKMIAKVDERIEVYISVIGPLETLFNSIRRMVTVKKELAALEGELSTLQQNKGAMIAAAAAAATAVEEQEQREAATKATTATTVGPNSRSRRNRKTRRRN
jgi:hypothetical protein